jgi:hypothetical protein
MWHTVLTLGVASVEEPDEAIFQGLIQDHQVRREEQRVDPTLAQLGTFYGLRGPRPLVSAAVAARSRGWRA